MKSTVAKNVRNSLQRMEEGEVFDYGRFRVGRHGQLALRKELSRLSQKGVISRIAKGRYLKRKQTRFGALQAREDQIIRSLTYKNDRIVGYVTGTTLYNKLGLTTQVPNVLVIARRNPQSAMERDGYKVRFVKRKIPRNDDEIRLVQLLDALRDIKKIPDTPPDKVLTILTASIKRLKTDDQKKLTRLAMTYNAATRALLGTVLKQSGKPD